MLLATAVFATVAAASSAGATGRGSLQSSVASFEHPLGDIFVVRWDNASLTLSVSSASGVSLSHDGASGGEGVAREYWASVPGEYFVAAAQGHWSAKERDGSFRIDTATGRKTSLQTVDAVASRTPTSLAVSGSLLLGGADAAGVPEGLNYTLTLSWNSSLPGHLSFDILTNGGATSGSTSTSGSDRATSTAGRRTSTTLAAAAVDDTPVFNQLFLHYSLDVDERIFGFGHQYSFCNLRGRTVPVMSTEQGIGRGLEPITTILNTFGGGSGGNWCASTVVRASHLGNAALVPSVKFRGVLSTQHPRVAPLHCTPSVCSGAHAVCSYACACACVRAGTPPTRPYRST
jgi:hypothetical protein